MCDRSVHTTHGGTTLPQTERGGRSVLKRPAGQWLKLSFAPWLLLEPTKTTFTNGQQVATASPMFSEWASHTKGSCWVSETSVHWQFLWPLAQLCGQAFTTVHRQC